MLEVLSRDASILYMNVHTSTMARECRPQAHGSNVFLMLSALRSTFSARVDCDLVDRLNYYYSSLALLVLAMFSLALALGGPVISCWCPGELRPSMVDYVETYCWATGTYALPLPDAAREAGSSRDAAEQTRRADPRQHAQPIRYYQWGARARVRAIDAMSMNSAPLTSTCTRKVHTYACSKVHVPPASGALLPARRPLAAARLALRCAVRFECEH